jgi:hypothetical protein
MHKIKNLKESIKMIDSRTLIKKVIEFDNAERIGYNFTGGYPNDLIMFSYSRRPDFDYDWHKPEDMVNEYPDLANFEGFVRKDLVLEQERVAQLNEMVMKELIGLIDNFAAVGSDAVMFHEDWGTQDRLLISPKLWREVFKPSFKVLCDRAHAKNMHVIMHSCGYIYEILEDLIEVGIDVFQFDQPTLMGIDRLSETFAKRVSLFSSVIYRRHCRQEIRSLLKMRRGFLWINSSALEEALLLRIMVIMKP